MFFQKDAMYYFALFNSSVQYFNVQNVALANENITVVQ